MFGGSQQREEFLTLTDHLDDMEMLYKQLYDLRNDSLAQRAFLNRLRHESATDEEHANDIEAAVDASAAEGENGLILFLNFLQHGFLSSMEETGYVFSASSDISLRKHDCYTPPFEHCHSFFEIIYVYKGSCRNQVGTEILELSEGDLCFITPGQKHSLEAYSEGIIINIMIRKSTFMRSFFFPMNDSNILSQFFYHALMDENGNRFLLFHTGQDEFVKGLVEYMYLENDHQKPYCSQILNSAVISLFFHLLRDHVQELQTDGAQEDGTTIVAILSYIQNHFQDLSLETAAQRFHYNPSYLGKLLKRSTGKNFTQLVRDCRMERACQLLTDSEYTIGAISTMVGYENVEHFNRTFRKTYQMTPSAWRKAHRD